MKKIKKRYIVIVVLFAILLFPVKSYIDMLSGYYRLYTNINPKTDSIFRETTRLATFSPEEFDENARLFYLCKVWGFVKYHYETTNERQPNPDMDKLLFRAIPLVVNSLTKEQYCAVLDSLFMFRDMKLTGSNPHQDLNDYALLDMNWMKDTLCLTPAIGTRLEEFFTTHSGVRDNHYIYNKSNVGNSRLTNETEYPIFDYTTAQDTCLVGLFRYWNVINYFYVYKNTMDTSWDKVLYTMIPRFRNIRSKKDYHKEVYRLTNQLKDSHASYPPSLDDEVFGPYRPNFRMKLIDSTFIISSIRLKDYKAENFRVGDIVLKVDGQDVSLLYDSLCQFVCGGNYWSNQGFGCNAVLSRYDTTTIFTLVRGIDTLQVESKNMLAYDMFTANRQVEKANEKKDLYKWINDSTAYLDLTSATGDNLTKNYKAIKSASVIIVDLRNYPDNDSFLDITDSFIPTASFFAYTTYPDTRFPGMVRYHKSSPPIGSEDAYKCRIIVLVNEDTESFSEYLTMALQANPKTVTVGNNSSGSDGNITLFEFPAGVKSLYSGVGIFYPDFTPTQRHGVRIDHVAEPTVESIRNNIDIAYEKAVGIATGANTPSKLH